MSEPNERRIIREVAKLRELAEEASGYGNGFEEVYNLAEILTVSQNIEIILGEMGITREKYLNDQLTTTDGRTS